MDKRRKLQIKGEDKDTRCVEDVKLFRKLMDNMESPENGGVCECEKPKHQYHSPNVPNWCMNCGKEIQPLPPQECKHEAFYHPVCVHCGKLVDDDYLIKTEKPPQEKGKEKGELSAGEIISMLAGIAKRKNRKG